MDKLFAVTKRLIYMSFLRERVWISICNDLGISTALYFKILKMIAFLLTIQHSVRREILRKLDSGE